MYNFIDFTGKKFVVTGASAGIGRQTAVTLSRLGAQMILIARREEQLEETMRMLEGEGHARYIADLSVIGNIEPLVKQIVAEQGKIDGLVYAAGIDAMIPLAQVDYDAMQKGFSINFFGFVEMVRRFSRKGRFQDKMRIVGISSVAADVGTKSHTVYAASKAAMDGAVRCMAEELAEKGICVNTIQPSLVDTPMAENFAKYYGSNDPHDVVSPRQYLGLCSPEDIANAAAFLLSPAARMITGISLSVDGGYKSN